MQKEVKLLMSPEAYAIAREEARQEGFTCVGTMIRRDVERFYIGRQSHGKSASEKSGQQCALPAESIANQGSQQCADEGSHNSCCPANTASDAVPQKGDALLQEYLAHGLAEPSLASDKQLNKQTEVIR